MYFMFLQLRNAVWAQFPDPVTVEPHSVERLLIFRIIDRTLSSIYSRLVCTLGSGAKRAFSAWQRDLPALTEEDWSEGLQQFIPLMILARERFIQLKFLHRVYYTPQILAIMYHTSEDRCPKCNREVGNHMVWLCPRVQEFWWAVAADMSSISGITVKLDPLVLLLGITDNLPTTAHKKLLVFLYCILCLEGRIPPMEGSGAA